MSIDRSNLTTEKIAQLRPWLDADGESWWTRADGVSKIGPVKAKLTPAQWAAADSLALAAFRRWAPLTCWLLDNDLKLDVNKLTAMELEPAEKAFEREVAAENRDDPPQFAFNILPLPIAHADAAVAAHDLKRNDFVKIEAASRRVAERTDDLLVGARGFEGISTLKKVLHGVDGVEPILVHEGEPLKYGLLRALNELRKRKWYGPFVTACATELWPDFRGVAGPVEGVIDVVATPSLKPEDGLLVVQATPDVCRMVVGWPLVVVQWEDQFKVLCCIVPQVRGDFYGYVGAAWVKPSKV